MLSPIVRKLVFLSIILPVPLHAAQLNQWNWTFSGGFYYPGGTGGTFTGTVCEAGASYQIQGTAKMLTSGLIQMVLNNDATYCKTGSAAGVSITGCANSAGTNCTQLTQGTSTFYAVNTGHALIVQPIFSGDTQPTIYGNNSSNTCPTTLANTPINFILSQFTGSDAVSATVGGAYKLVAGWLTMGVTTSQLSNYTLGSLYTINGTAFTTSFGNWAATPVATTGSAPCYYSVGSGAVNGTDDTSGFLYPLNTGNSFFFTSGGQRLYMGLPQLPIGNVQNLNGLYAGFRYYAGGGSQAITAMPMWLNGSTFGGAPGYWANTSGVAETTSASETVMISIPNDATHVDYPMPGMLLGTATDSALGANTGNLICIVMVGDYTKYVPNVIFCAGNEPGPSGSSTPYNILLSSQPNTPGTLNTSAPMGSCISGTGTVTSLTAGSATLTLSAANTSIAAGQSVAGTGIPSGTTVSSVSGATITMSQTAMANEGANTYTFCPTGMAVPVIESASSDTGRQVVAMSDGRFVVGGYGTAQTKGLVARFTSFGTLDTTFNTTGYALTAYNGTSTVLVYEDVAVYPTTTAYGSITSGSNQITTLSPSTGAGIVVGQLISGTGIPASTTVSAISGTTVTMSANATATNAVAKLLFGTYANEIAAVGESGTYTAQGGTWRDLVVTRYTDSGLDAAFNTTGINHVNPTTKTQWQAGWQYAVIVDGNAGNNLNKVVIAGYGGGTNPPTGVLARFTTAGKIDNSTNDATAPFGGASGFVTNTSCSFQGAYIDSSDNVYGVGDDGTNICIAKYNSAGTLVAAYGTSGLAKAGISGGTSYGGFFYDAKSGKMVVGAKSNNNNYFAVIRFTSTGVIDNSTNDATVPGTSCADGQFTTNGYFLSYVRGHPYSVLPGPVYPGCSEPSILLVGNGNCGDAGHTAGSLCSGIAANTGTPPDGGVALLRLNWNGSYDQSFNNQCSASGATSCPSSGWAAGYSGYPGWLYTGFSDAGGAGQTLDWGYGAAILSDGEVIVTGQDNLTVNAKVGIKRIWY